jgi:AraC-like DNA-binding protein
LIPNAVLRVVKNTTDLSWTNLSLNCIFPAHLTGDIVGHISILEVENCNEMSELAASFGNAFFLDALSGAKLRSVSAGTMTVAWMQTDSGVIWPTLPAREERWRLILPVDGSCLDASHDVDTPILMRANEPGWTPGSGSGFVYIEFGTNDLKRVASRNEFSTIIRELSPRLSHISRKRLQKFIHQLSLLRLNEAELRRFDVVSIEAVFAQYQGLLVDLLLIASESETDGPRANTSERILEKALAYIEDHHVGLQSVDDLAAGVHTSSRNLQYIFRRCLNVSPSEYIKRYRLHQFKQMLDSGGTVTHSASSVGFKHLGRLAKSYQRTYGHLPSQPTGFIRQQGQACLKIQIM